MKEEDLPPGPFTLEEAEKSLSRLEDIATINRDLGFALQAVVINMFARLSASRAIDGPRFIADLMAESHHLEGRNYQLALEVMAAAMQQALLSPKLVVPAPPRGIH